MTNIKLNFNLKAICAQLVIRLFLYAGPTKKLSFSYYICFSPIYLLCLATDTVRTGLNIRGIDTILRTVGKEHAELKGWLPGPPIAILILAAELMTAFSVLSHFEVEGILLR